jgi:S1-C subfamily serine protease
MLLKTINYSSENFTHISTHNPRIGAKVHIVGHTARVEFTYFSGSVSGFRIEENPDRSKQYLVHITAPIYMGNSGGGAFDENGNLIGICSFFRKNVPNMSFFVEVKTINKFVFSN